MLGHLTLNSKPSSNPTPHRLFSGKQRSSAAPDLNVTIENAEVGAMVRRGPNWCWSDQDGGKNGTGVITKVLKMHKLASVRWQHGAENKYRIGRDDKHDLEFTQEWNTLTPEERIQSAKKNDASTTHVQPRSEPRSEPCLSQRAQDQATQTKLKHAQEQETAALAAAEAEAIDSVAAEILLARSEVELQKARERDNPEEIAIATAVYTQLHNKWAKESAEAAVAVGLADAAKDSVSVIEADTKLQNAHDALRVADGEEVAEAREALCRAEEETKRLKQHAIDTQIAIAERPQSLDWYVMVDKIIKGPLRVEDIARLWGESYSEDSMVWTVGMAGWQPIKTVQSLVTLLQDGMVVQSLMVQNEMMWKAEDESVMTRRAALYESSDMNWAREAIREAEARLAAVASMESADGGVILEELQSLSGRLQACNRNMLRIKDEIRGIEVQLEQTPELQDAEHEIANKAVRVLELQRKGFLEDAQLLSLSQLDQRDNLENQLAMLKQELLDEQIHEEAMRRRQHVAEEVSDAMALWEDAQRREQELLVLAEHGHAAPSVREVAAAEQEAQEWVLRAEEALAKTRQQGGEQKQLEIELLDALDHAKDATALLSQVSRGQSTAKGAGEIEWYVKETADSDVWGPLTVVDIARRMGKEGMFDETSLVWTVGMAEWQCVGAIPDLASAVDATMPPMSRPISAMTTESREAVAERVDDYLQQVEARLKEMEMEEVVVRARSRPSSAKQPHDVPLEIANAASSDWLVMEAVKVVEEAARLVEEEDKARLTTSRRPQEDASLVMDGEEDSKVEEKGSRVVIEAEDAAARLVKEVETANQTVEEVSQKEVVEEAVKLAEESAISLRVEGEAEGEAEENVRLAKGTEDTIHAKAIEEAARATLAKEIDDAAKLAKAAEVAAKEADGKRLAAEEAAQNAVENRMAAEAAAKKANDDRLVAEEGAKKAAGDRLAAEEAAKKALHDRSAAEAAAKQANENQLAAEEATEKANADRLKAEVAAKKANEDRLEGETTKKEIGDISAANVVAKKVKDDTTEAEAAKLSEDTSMLGREVEEAVEMKEADDPRISEQTAGDTILAKNKDGMSQGAASGLLAGLQAAVHEYLVASVHMPELLACLQQAVLHHVRLVSDTKADKAVIEPDEAARLANEEETVADAQEGEEEMPLEDFQSAELESEANIPQHTALAFNSRLHRCRENTFRAWQERELSGELDTAVLQLCAETLEAFKQAEEALAEATLYYELLQAELQKGAAGMLGTLGPTDSVRFRAAVAALPVPSGLSILLQLLEEFEGAAVGCEENAAKEAMHEIHTYVTMVDEVMDVYAEVLEQGTAAAEWMVAETAAIEAQWAQADAERVASRGEVNMWWEFA